MLFLYLLMWIIWGAEKKQKIQLDIWHIFHIPFYVHTRAEDRQCNEMPPVVYVINSAKQNFVFCSFFVFCKTFLVNSERLSFWCFSSECHVVCSIQYAFIKKRMKVTEIWLCVEHLCVSQIGFLLICQNRISKFYYLIFKMLFQIYLHLKKTCMDPRRVLSGISEHSKCSSWNNLNSLMLLEAKISATCRRFYMRKPESKCQTENNSRFITSDWTENIWQCTLGIFTGCFRAVYYCIVGKKTLTCGRFSGLVFSKYSWILQLGTTSINHNSTEMICSMYHGSCNQTLDAIWKISVSCQHKLTTMHFSTFCTSKDFAFTSLNKNSFPCVTHWFKPTKAKKRKIKLIMAMFEPVVFVLDFKACKELQTFQVSLNVGFHFLLIFLISDIIFLAFVRQWNAQRLYCVSVWVSNPGGGRVRLLLTCSYVDFD